MDWTKATELLNAAERVIIVTHVSPDGDAIGTLLGLGHALRGIGKTVTLAVDGGVPPSLSFLPGSDAVKKELHGVEADLYIAVDCGDEARTGEAGKQARALGVSVINIDHHWSNPGFGNVDMIEAAWVSASDGVFEWLTAMNTPISPDAAQCLLCGLVTDTLCFRTDSTKPNTLGIAQRLMELGGDLSTIVQQTVSRVQTNTLRLWAQVMPTLKVEDKVIWIKVGLADRKAASLPDNETKDGGLSSLLVQADDAYISCVITERDGGKVELSFRAKPGFDTSIVALALGGGGHKLASGATVMGTLDTVEAQVIPMLKEVARVGTPTV
jgi:phosphoesterase RecJ-like protein